MLIIQPPASLPFRPRLSSGRLSSVSAARKARKDRAAWPPLHFRRPNPAPKVSLALPDLKVNPDVSELRVHRALLDRRVLQGRRASPVRQDLRASPVVMGLQD